ncbi:hypothetical protein ASPACDRAFT_1852231 [Aspergillus aculeatus ATCC 16872]|uniref:Uncharacterized protein n=1 Tax=Aspergillus aculeatus (strain ATCC 16872 / CBS 172.66 / WB 5094) TaxID=690307 RepID=A0A1L9XA13_ASPA1|nr:uncharacterized protein ASPACDRAFT_1852231 [Aspergillus aculeatus ATCC 16872]OJK05287.1 hypothetical protein ASPACDRAFT_1852231 [Aspergillus aculeatus ATCC 16872]
MLIYSGKFSYSPYATNELFSVVFRDNVQTGDRVAVILQWSKDAGGQVKSNSNHHGTVSKVSTNGSGEKEIEIFQNEKDSTYYWWGPLVSNLESLLMSYRFHFRYKGKVAGETMTLSMWNKGGEEVTKDIKLQLVFF